MKNIFIYALYIFFYFDVWQVTPLIKWFIANMMIIFN